MATKFAREVDLAVFGENHIYKGFGIPFDPEGLIASIPAVATVLLGYISGRLIERSGGTSKAIKKLTTYGSVLVVVGWFWGYIFPINKALWTSSYVLFAGGLAMVFLGILLWIIDIKGIKKWSNPFIHFGTNPLFIFVFSGLYVKSIIYLIKTTDSSGEVINGYKYLYTNIFVPIGGNMNGSLLFAITHILFFWLLVYVLYKRKIFIKI